MNQQLLSEDQQRVLWFIRLRWAALGLMAIIVLFLKLTIGVNINTLFALAIVGLGAAYNFIYPFIIKRFKPFSENILFTYFRVILDLIVITALVHLTGGVESPFNLLYLLEMVTISMFGMIVPAYVLSAAATFFFLTVNLLEAYFILPHYRLGTMPGTLFLNTDYIFARGFTLFLTCILLIYMTSYLASKFTEKQKKIEELSKAKLDFVDVVMHETKSPLTSIIGYAGLLESQGLGPITERQKEPLGIIKRQAQRILAMANDLLSLARLESGMAKIDKKPAKLTELAGHVIEEFGPQLEERKISLIQEFDPKTPDVPLDEDKLIEVFTNLLSNAVKFSNAGGKIFLSIAPRDKEILVSIRDEGLGIEPGDLPHIFERFYRAGKESSERKGTGLGLTLVKTIIESHGGKIWAVSAGRGQGAVFYFTLPV